MPEPLRLGTRGSRLALAQVELVRPLFADLGHEIEPVVIRTSGDRGDRERLGAFVGELQHALLAGEVDAALHCLKDLPTRPVEGLELAAYLEREDPAETLISRHGGLADLPHGATVGTGSVRRTAQLSALRPDLQFRPLVGNVDTRLEKLRRGEYDAIVLAVAGLRRLGVWPAWTDPELRVEVLTIDAMIPAPGQGVLVLESRSGHRAVPTLHALNHPASEWASRAERSFLATFGGGCSVPIGAYATVDDAITVDGFVSGHTVRHTGAKEHPEAVGRAAAEILIAQGVAVR